MNTTGLLIPDWASLQGFFERSAKVSARYRIFLLSVSTAPLVGSLETLKAHLKLIKSGKPRVAIRVTERRMDAKRRVTIPSTVSLKAGSKVVIIASTDSAIIAPDTEIAEDIAKLLQELKSKKKQMVLSEWEALIAGAGLLRMSSEKIDQAVARKIKRRSDHVDVSEATGNR